MAIWSQYILIITLLFLAAILIATPIILLWWLRKTKKIAKKGEEKLKGGFKNEVKEKEKSSRGIFGKRKARRESTREVDRSTMDSTIPKPGDLPILQTSRTKRTKLKPKRNRYRLKNDWESLAATVR